RLADAGALEQGLVAFAGGQHIALGQDLPTIDLQAGDAAPAVALERCGTGNETVAGELGEPAHHIRYVQYQFAEAVDLAPEGWVGKYRRQLAALDLIHPATQGLAGEEAGQ